DHSIDFLFPTKGSKCLTLSDILEPDELVDKKYWASEGIVAKTMEKVEGREIIKPAIWHENKAGDIGINEFSCALRAGASYNYLLVTGGRRRTRRELL